MLNLIHNVSLRLFDASGNVKDERFIHNYITTAGKVAVTKQVIGDASAGSQPAKFNYGALGSSASSASSTALTALNSELTAGSRAQDTGPTFSGAQGDLVFSFAAGVGTGAVKEAGLFNAASSGTMLARVTFSTVNKGATDAMQVTWQITTSAA